MKPPHINKFSPMLLLTAFSIVGCGESGPELSVAEVQIVAPAPGRSASVAYMTITNRGGTPAVLMRISSKQYATVELHETVLVNGVARMQALDYITIDANGSTGLAPGGKHVMLFEPSQAWLPDNNISLQLHFESGAILMVSAPISTRIDVN